MNRSLRFSPLFLLLFVALGVGCGDDPAADDGARITFFRADPASLEGPGEVTLSWDTRGAVVLSLLQDGEALELGGDGIPSGSRVVELASTSTFELIASGRKGTPQSRALTVNVGEGPSIGSLAAPETVQPDELGIGRATISWTGVTGADELRLEADPGASLSLPAAAMPDGQVEVEFEEDTTFTLVASGPGGESRESVSIRLLLPPTIDRLEADRSRIGPAETVSIEWSTSFAARVELWVDGLRSAEVEGGETSGSVELALLFDTEIELRAYNEAGDEAKESITVTVGPPMIVSFAPSVERIWLGDPVVLSWETLGAFDFRIEANDEAICTVSTFAEMASSSCAWEPKEPGLYTVRLEIVNAATSVSESLEVSAQVGAGILAFAPSAEAVDQGKEFLLSWRVVPDPEGGIPTLALRDDRGATHPISGEMEGSLTLAADQVGPWSFTLRAETGSARAQPVESVATVRVVPLPEVSLVATPSHFDDSEAEDVVLSWTSSGVESLRLYRLEEGVPVDLLDVPEAERSAGSIHLLPQEDTAYRLVGTSPSGTTAQAEATVTIAPTDIVSFTADPMAVTAGQPVVLRWVTRTADTISLDLFDTPYLPEETQAPFIDVTSQGGEPLELGDDCGAASSVVCAFLGFPIGFTFEFGGVERQGITVFGAGVASFELPRMVAAPDENQDLPNSEAAWAHLAPFWDALTWDARRHPHGKVFSLFRPDPAGDSIVIQWQEMGLVSDPEAKLSFELILWENGDFEYRYGAMLAGSRAGANLENGASATIGFQLPDGSASHVRAFNDRVGVRGALGGRTFSYRRPPVVEKSGSFVWHPYSHLDTASATLRIEKDEVVRSQRVTVDIASRPEVELLPGNPAPVLPGEELRLAWRSFHATGLEVVDALGISRCKATTQAEVDEGVCILKEEVEGRYEYRVLATGAHGFVLETPLVGFFSEPFGIVTFDADRLQVEAGDDITLTWTVRRASSVVLLADGVPVFTDLAPTENGSFVVQSITANTEFTLRVESPIGLEEEESIEVELWTVALDLDVSSLSVRPGEPVDLEITAADLDGGPAPVVYGTFPLREVTDPGSRFVDHADTPGVVALTINQNSSSAMLNVDFPEGFTFPFYGEAHDAIRIFLDGYVSFDLTASTATTNQLLPIRGLTQAFYRGVALAPFWDDLHPRMVGTIHAGNIDANTFVVQWSRMSTSTGTTTAAPIDLNFQLVLFRDGSFEYRYGNMNHHVPPASGAACNPSTCENEANGSSATIGYQRGDTSTGYMHHFGGSSGGVVANAPFPGGLSNRTLRYDPVRGTGLVTLRPNETGTYSYCVKAGVDLLCKSFDITADFGLDEFKASKDVLEFGEQVVLSWKTRGGTSLTIRDGEDVRYTTSDLATIDQGSVSLDAGKNTEFVLELEAGTRSATASTSVRVERLKIMATAPNLSQIGERVTLSWTMQNQDVSLQPVVIKPMEEDSSLLFSEFDLQNDPGATQLIGSGVDAQIVKVEWKDFRFNYLGRDQDLVQISSEGYLSFDAAATNAPNNVSIPTTHATNRRIHLAPFWDDLRTGATGGVFGKQVDPDRYVIQWSGMSLKPELAELNFLVVLHRNGAFEFRYGHMNPGEGGAGCFPQSCINEVNGSSATIGYQDPTGSAGHLFHFGGSGRGQGQRSVQGGLANRSWKFTRQSGSGSVQIEPSETQLYRICAIDPVHGDIFCAAPIEVEAPSWGILSFEVSPHAPQAGEELVMSWSVRGVDQLRIFANETELANYTGELVPSSGSLPHLPAVPTTYRLEAFSLGRAVSVERQVDLRTFSLQVTGPSGIRMPGEKVNLSWTTTVHSAGDIRVAAPMMEIDARPGAPGAFVDISTLEGATQVTLSHGNGFGDVALPRSPFSFPYFGTVYTEVQVFVDGYISLTRPSGFGNGLNAPLPVADNVIPIHLAPFWDDLQTRGDDQVWTYQPSPDRFVIQWTRFNRSQGSETAAGRYNLNFQVVLFEDGAFEYRYGTMAPPAPPFSDPTACSPGSCEREANGSSATIGYQTLDNRFGYTVHFGGVEKNPEIEAATGAGGGAFLAFPGGLSNRSFRFEPALSGTAEITVGRTREHRICAFSSTFSECKSVTIEAVADPGDLMFTELMIAPTGGADRQWFEVRNLTSRPIDLQGFRLRSSGGSHVIQGSLVVAPGGFANFAASSLAGIGASYHYGTGMPLGATSDRLELIAGTAVIASVDWGIDWTIPQGRTLSLDPSFHMQGNDNRRIFNQWCDGGPSGSPGTLGMGCKNSGYDVDPTSDMPFIDISSTGSRLFDAEATGALALVPGSTFHGSFFGQPIERLWVSANGWISFSELQPTPTSGPPFLLPRGANDTSAREVVAAYWDSLRCDRRQYDCKVFVFQGKVGADDVTIVQWDGFQHATGPGSLTFQIQLWGNRDIVVAFDEVSSPFPMGSRGFLGYRGAGTWVGVEGSERSNYLTAHHMGDVEFSGRSFHFMAK